MVIPAPSAKAKPKYLIVFIFIFLSAVFVFVFLHLTLKLSHILHFSFSKVYPILGHLHTHLGHDQFTPKFTFLTTPGSCAGSAACSLQTAAATSRPQSSSRVRGQYTIEAAHK